MSDNTTLEYNLPVDAYVNFDAVSLKNFIIQRLNENSKFTDQNYEGSNLSSLIDIISYTTHVLLFYLNQTSSEAVFDQASIYENMNRIIKLIGYKPTGQQTSQVAVNCVASAALPINSYLFKKYSYFLIDNVQYTIISDFAFEKLTSNEESIKTINDNLILYQGSVEEYPSYISEGLDFETFPIVVDNLVDATTETFIADGTISIYVKEKDTDTWIEYLEVGNLYLASSNERVFELRLNENGHYEVKFGNSTFGKKLNFNDEVKAFYILSDGNSGIISKNIIKNNKLFLYSSPTFNDIYSDISTVSSEIVSSTTSSLLNFSNPLNSTAVNAAETVNDLKNNVPHLVASQLRLVTESDYESFLNKNISNIVNSIKVVNNSTFLEEYIQYYYDICVDPNKVNRVILNQVNFVDACDFNNVNIFCVPKFEIAVDENYPPFLSNSFKNLLLNLTNDKKILSHAVIPRDPIYYAFDVGYSIGSPSKLAYDNSRIEIILEKNSRLSKQSIKQNIKNEILNFFKSENNKLGQNLNLSNLTGNILSIEGIKSIQTVNTLENSIFNGISFVAWNPIFEHSDVRFVNQNLTLPYFKFPYFYRPNNLINKIEIINE